MTIGRPRRRDEAGGDVVLVGEVAGEGRKGVAGNVRQAWIAARIAAWIAGQGRHKARRGGTRFLARPHRVEWLLLLIVGGIWVAGAGGVRYGQSTDYTGAIVQ